MGKGNRRSTRVPEYDYTLPGAYFVTTVAYQREMMFGEIENDEMSLNARGKIVSNAGMISRAIFRMWSWVHLW